jgi:putative acetyltransferase
MLEGLIVRRAAIEDAHAYARIMGDSRVFGNLLQMPFTDTAIWKQRLTERLAPGKSDLMLVAEHKGEIVGTGGLNQAPQMRRQHVWMLGITIAPEVQGQGVGSALMHAMCDYADNWAAAKRIELTVFTDNEAAQALYRKFGFVIEGTQRAYAMRNGHLVDVHAMARLHPSLSNSTKQ